MLGLPKGSLEESTRSLFAKAGWRIVTDSRSYRPTIDDPELDGRFVRAQEVSRYVEHGFFDCGLTGLDWIQENGSDVVEVCDLVYSRASAHKSRWVLCVAEDSPVRVPKDLAGKRVATELVQTVTRYFAARNGATPSLEEVRNAVRSIRAQKGMLLVPGDADCRSAGSFFKNPVVPVTVLDSLSQDLGVEKRSIPAYPAQEGEVKLSAAWLIERAGYSKGYALGNAGISSRHTLALINRGGASAAEVVALRDQVTDTIASRFGIRLEPEPVWLA